MSPEERAKKFLTENLPTMEGYDELVAAFRAAVAEEREAIVEIIENFAAMNEDETCYPGLADWVGSDDTGRWVINPEKLVELIRSRP